MAVRGRDIRDFHNAIVHSVKTPYVVSELVSADVISLEDGNRVKHYFLNGEPAKGCEEMMICFYKSTQPRKERALLAAFESAEYPYLKTLIEGTGYEDISHKHAKKILQIFTPKLEKQLQCLPILADLYSRDVLSEDDKEYITTVQINKGNTYAMIVLLERMQCRVSPDKWYFDFLDVLSKKGYKHLVEELEPGFINNPSSFMPKFGSNVLEASLVMSCHVEEQLLFFRREFVRCIKDPKIVSPLAASCVISESDSSRLKDLYLRGNSQKATEELVDCVLKSQTPGKWQSFLEALTQAEYPYLKSLLESYDRPVRSLERERQIIRVFSPMIETNLNGKEILEELYSDEVLSETDLEIIKNYRPTYATIDLLERMQCRKPPDEWYYAFLKALDKKGYKFIIKEIEEDFLKNPEQFRPLSDDVCTSESELVSKKVQSESFEEAWMAGNSLENVRQESYVDMDNEATPTTDNGSIFPNYTNEKNNRENKSENIAEPNGRSKTMFISANAVHGIDDTDDGAVSVRDYDKNPNTDDEKVHRCADLENSIRPLDLTVCKNNPVHMRLPDDGKESGKGKCENPNKETRVVAIVSAYKEKTEGQIIYSQVTDDKIEKEQSRARMTDINHELKSNIYQRESIEHDAVTIESGDSMVSEAVSSFGGFNRNIEQEDVTITAQSKCQSLAVSAEMEEEEDNQEYYLGGESLKLRKYQLELAENAVAGKNTIICAPTGCGKTWVALHIIEEHLCQDVSAGDRRVVFMARNGALVGQHVQRIRKYLPHRKVKHLTGSTEEAQMMHVFIDDCEIFCITPQILVNNLDREVKSLTKFSLLIFDECHHTTGREPYVKLMCHYLVELSKGEKGLPQIVGMTASLGSGKAKSEDDALEHIYRICACLNARHLSTVEDNLEELKLFCNVPTEDTIQMKKRHFDPCKGILLQCRSQVEEILKDLVSELGDPTMTEIVCKMPSDKNDDKDQKRYKLWTSNLIKRSETLQEKKGRDTRCCGHYLQIFTSAIEINRLLQVPNVTKYLSEQYAQESENAESLKTVEKQLLGILKDAQKNLMTVRESNPNVHILTQNIKALFENEEGESRAMVFVEARATVRALVAFLNEELNDMEVPVGFLIGKETRKGDRGMTEDEQTETLEKFRLGEYKVIVATSIGIEGIDVPDCNLILNYSYHGDEITKIQMKGRSRKGGKAITVGNEQLLEKDKISMYRIHLMQKAIERLKKIEMPTVNRKLLSIQRKVQEEFENAAKIESLKRQKKTDETDYQVQCRKCHADLCYSSEIRNIDGENLHVVCKEDFGNKVKKVSHNKRARMGVLTKKYKMLCKGCSNDLGVIGLKLDSEKEYYVLALRALRFVNCSNNVDISTYEKWSDVKYKVKEIGSYELQNMYGNDSTGNV